MGVQEISDADASKIGSGVVVLDFWATWCGPCRAYAPKFQQVADAHDDGVVFGKVDIDAAPALTVQFGVQSVPTTVVLRDGQVVTSRTGVMTPTVLEGIIAQAR